MVKRKWEPFNKIKNNKFLLKKCWGKCWGKNYDFDKKLLLLVPCCPL